MAFDPVTAGLNLGKDLLGMLKSYFPGKIPPEMEAQIEERAQESFRGFVVQYEGAAKDYKDIPVIGPIVLLFRGLIRPAMTLMTAYLDYLYFKPSSNWSGEQGDLLWMLNLLVMGFWFGERAMKNTGAADILKAWLAGKK